MISIHLVSRSRGKGGTGGWDPPPGNTGTDPLHAWIQKGDRGSRPDPPLKNHKNRVSKQYWSALPENHKATKSDSMLGHHLLASETPKWRFTGGLMMARLKWYLDPPFPHQLKKMSKLDPSDNNFWICACPNAS